MRTMGRDWYKGGKTVGSDLVAHEKKKKDRRRSVWVGVGVVESAI